MVGVAILFAVITIMMAFLIIFCAALDGVVAGGDTLRTPLDDDENSS